MTKLRGNCPMGCGETLFAGAAGQIVCMNSSCPDPSVVDDLLGDAETEHIVVLGKETYTVQHPLRERRAELFTCTLPHYLYSLDGPPHAPGTYRVTWHEGVAWHDDDEENPVTWEKQ